MNRAYGNIYNMIYMDNAATTKMRPEVVRAMLPYMENRYANPSGIYSFSKNIKKDINNARNILAATINANPEEIFFTSGGTESDNWALKMAADEHKKGHIITTQIEHHAILKTCDYLEKKGFEVTRLKPDREGVVSAMQVKNAMRRDTFFISVMTANNEIGTIEPIAEIGSLARNRGVLFHTDAVQAYTNLKLDVKKMDIDMLSVSAHKLNGPKGAGFLYIRSQALKTPFINGGSQESGMRAGTENVAGIIGLAKAAEIAADNMPRRVNYEISMRDYMIKRIMSEIDYVRLNGHEKNRLPNNMNFSFEYIDGATLIMMLDSQGICASSGSACSSASAKPSHVLLSIGLSDELAHSSVRFSINEHITRREIDYCIECLKRDIKELRQNCEEYKKVAYKAGYIY